MKKYRDLVSEMDDERPSRKDYKLREDQKKEKRMKNALRSKNYADLIDEEEDDNL